jgi:glycine cleavage system regulatory protein
MTSLTLTLIGRDRPGLVRVLSERVEEAGGNWLESRMARLGGQFAGILRVDVPGEAADRLIEALKGLEAEGLHVTVEQGTPEETAGARRSFALELVGHDRPGIVHEIAEVLARHKVNIEELETEVVSGSFSGDALFKAQARLRAPEGVPAEELRQALETLAHELMVDISLDEAEGAG